MPNLRSLPLCALAGALLCTLSQAQSPASAVRILNRIDDNHLVALQGNVNPLANAANDRGPASAGLLMSDLTLVLSRSAEQQAAFDAFVEGQYDSGSPNFHQWLTPQQIGERFGPAEADITTISSWLAGQGFAVTAISPDRMTINFTGTAGQVRSAFHAEIHNLSVNGVAHIANVTDPQIPEALSAVVIGVKGLHNFFPHPLHRTGNKVQLNSSTGGWQRLQDSPSASLASGGVPVAAAAVQPAASLRPMYTYSGSGYVVQDITPYDFATVYNILPLWQKSTPINGTGQTIAVIGTSDINASDIALFKSTFGLPAGLAPIIAHPPSGSDPGVCGASTKACGTGDLEENTLDVEWSGAVAPGAQVVLVTTAYTYDSQNNTTNDPILQSAQYVIDNVNTSGSPVFNARIMSISYGQCELGMGTSGNVLYRNLWQTAAAAGIAVFVASGDAGSPACDQGGDSNGYPYSAQYGLAVNGLASTPFNTAVGGTDFKWCNPSYSSTGTFQGCASSNATTYWNSSNTAGTQATAKGYVPEAPWNDACLNPVWATYVESIATFLGYTTSINPEAACNFVYNKWKEINAGQVSATGHQFVLAWAVDSVGAGGGASNCIVNDNANSSSCSGGWPKPSWQTGIAGIPADGVRDLPDVSFFSGDGSLNSATLVCLASVGATCSGGNFRDVSSGGTALEIGGTSVATPEMAGIMALINQNAGSPQGNPNPKLYQLAARQNYASCTAESGTTANGCYFNDVDQGTISMPCAVSTQTVEGGAVYTGTAWNVNATTYAALASPNCAALNSGDVVGTLISSGTTPGFNAGAGFDLATGLGSMNVANVVNAANLWLTAGGASSTVTVTPASNSITPDASLSVTVAVTGTSGTPTGTVTLSSGTYGSSAATLSSGNATIVIPGNSLTGATNPFTATITATYSGDATYAQNTGTATVTVTKRTPTVTVTPAANPTNSNVPLNVTVAVTGAGGTPTGTVTLSAAGGTFNLLYSGKALAGGSATFTIPANAFTAGGTVTLTSSYSGDTTYVAATGSSTVAVTYIAVIAPTVTVTPASSSVNTGQSLSVAVAVGGTRGAGIGSVTLSSGTYTSAATALVSGSATIVIPANKLSAGTATLTASFPGDANYIAGTGTATVTVTQSSFALTAGTPSPSSVTKGSSSTVSISGSTSSSGYSGTVSFASGSCVLTAYPTSASATPTCSASGTIVYSGGTPTGTATATVATTPANAELVYPRLGNGKGWLGAGGGAVLAFIVFLGIPARRRSWRAMLGMIVLLAGLGTLSGCTSKISTGGTTSGSYTFTITGTGNDSAATKASTTFTIAVN